MTPDTYSPWYCNPTWWAVFVALSIGIAGIFREWIVSKIFRPRLSSYSDFCRPVKVRTHTEKYDIISPEFGLIEIGLLRLRIENHGSRFAEDVEVMITELEVLNSRGKYISDHGYLPGNLLWSSSGKVTMPRIQPHLHKFCEMGYFLPAKKLNPSRSSIKLKDYKISFVLGTEAQSNADSNILKPGDYRIRVVVSGNNVSTKMIDYRLVFSDGDFQFYPAGDLQQSLLPPSPFPLGQ
jgi:hypothetical protein